MRTEMDEKKLVSLNAQIEALEIAVSTIADHLRHNSDGFADLANNTALAKGLAVNDVPQDQKPRAAEVLEHLKKLLHAPRD